MIKEIVIKIIFRIIIILPKIKIIPESIVKNLKNYTKKKYNHSIVLNDLIVDYDLGNKRILEKLKTYGICVVRNIFSKVDYSLSTSEIERYVFDRLSKLKDQSCVELKDILVQKNSYVLKNYNDFCNYKLPVLNVRGSQNDIKNNINEDFGFIDLFHIDRIKFTEKTMKIINFANKFEGIFQNISNVKKRTSNLYLSNEIKLIRGLHIDSPKKEYKIFMYLTSVDSSDCGAFRYVPYSHRYNLLMILNLIINKFRVNYENITNSSLCDDINAINILGKPGDVIISDQRGIHGGNNQSKGKKRLMLMNSYF